MRIRQNEILTAIKVLIENKMYNEAINMIDIEIKRETETQLKLYPGRGGGGNGRCVVCGDKNGHGGLQCPDFSSKSKEEWLKS